MTHTIQARDCSPVHLGRCFGRTKYHDEIRAISLREARRYLLAQAGVPVRFEHRIAEPITTWPAEFRARVKSKVGA